MENSIKFSSIQSKDSLLPEGIIQKGKWRSYPPNWKLFWWLMIQIKNIFFQKYFFLTKCPITGRSIFLI